MIVSIGILGQPIRHCLVGQVHALPDCEVLNGHARRSLEHADQTIAVTFDRRKTRCQSDCKEVKLKPRL